MEKKPILAQEMHEMGYVYLGEMAPLINGHQQRQLWRWRDELIIYSPEDQEISWRQSSELN